jgi:hypothetical protein
MRIADCGMRVKQKRKKGLKIDEREKRRTKKHLTLGFGEL